MRCDDNLALGRTTWRVTSRSERPRTGWRRGRSRGAPISSPTRCRAATPRSSSPPASCTTNPVVVVACQPTRGTRPGRRGAARGALLEFADRGGAVLWIAAELDELLEVADRIVVAFHGRLSDAPSSRRTTAASSAWRWVAASDVADRGGVVAQVVTPLLSVVAAFAVGAVIIAWAGENPAGDLPHGRRRGVVRAVRLARHADPGDTARADRRRPRPRLQGRCLEHRRRGTDDRRRRLLDRASSATSTTFPAPC